MKTLKITEDYNPITHISPFSNDNNGYPMWFKKTIEGDIHTIDMCHNKPVNVGELFNCRDSKTIIIDEIIEKRKPGKYGKNNHSKGVDFYSIRGEIVDILR